jgi:hypothetical protein
LCGEFALDLHATSIRLVLRWFVDVIAMRRRDIGLKSTYSSATD